MRCSFGVIHIAEGRICDERMDAGRGTICVKEVAARDVLDGGRMSSDEN